MDVHGPVVDAVVVVAADEGHVVDVGGAGWVAGVDRCPGRVVVQLAAPGADVAAGHGAAAVAGDGGQALAQLG